MGRRVEITPEELKRKCDAVSSISQVFDLLADNVVITDIDSNIVYANKAAQSKTGFTLKEMLGKNPGDLWGGRMPTEMYEEMYHAIRELKQSWRGKVKNHRRDGTEYWQWLRVSPILDENNECLYFVAIESDTDSSKLETVEQINRSLLQRISLTDFIQGQAIKIADLTKAVEKLKTKLDEHKDKGKKTS